MYTLWYILFARFLWCVFVCLNKDVGIVNIICPETLPSLPFFVTNTFSIGFYSNTPSSNYLNFFFFLLPIRRHNSKNKTLWFSQVTCNIGRPYLFSYYILTVDARIRITRRSIVHRARGIIEVFLFLSFYRELIRVTFWGT